MVSFENIEFVPRFLLEIMIVEFVAFFRKTQVREIFFSLTQKGAGRSLHGL